MKEQLLEIQESIENAKSENSKLAGKKENLEEQLKTEYGCSSIEEAKKKETKLQTEIEKLEKEIEEKETKIKEIYEIEE